jgi:hypothetical protein
MTYYIDIDNTICLTINSDYESSQPILHRIEKINKLYESGNEIIYWTARGAKSGKEWTSFTSKQLDGWNCLRHKLLMGKPSYDVLIDDKAMSLKDFFND